MNALSKFLSTAIVSFFLMSPAQSQDNLPYGNPKLPVEQRIADLLSRMTLDEKIAQLISAMERVAVASDPNSSLTDQKRNLDPERAAAFLKNGTGEVARPGGTMKGSAALSGNCIPVFTTFPILPGRS
jgi:beta-glucosidase